MSPELRTVSDPVFPKGQKNITQGLGFDEMVMTQVISELNNIYTMSPGM